MVVEIRIRQVEIRTRQVEIRTRHCRVPTINHGRETALPCPLYLRLIMVGKRHCRVLYIIPAQPELILLLGFIQSEKLL